MTKESAMKKYIFGMITVIFAIPLLETLTELCQVAIEVPKGVLSRCVIRINKDIKELQEDHEQVNTNCIGFAAPTNGYENDDDEC